MPAVPEHRDGVSDQIKLLEPMSDKDDRRSLVAQAAYDPEQLFDLRRGERGRRLVEDQKTKGSSENS
jgi:hypothetical protein